MRKLAVPILLFTAIAGADAPPRPNHPKNASATLSYMSVVTTQLGAKNNRLRSHVHGRVH